MAEAIGNILGKTSDGDVFVMQAFMDGKVIIELLKHQVTFEPQMIIHEGQFAFSGSYIHNEVKRDILILGSNDMVRLFEKAKAILE